MAWEIEIKNFQAIDHLRILLEGFVVLEGPSNIGKSAIFRAIKGLLTNKSGTAFVRHSVSCIRQEGKKCGCFSQVRLTNTALNVDVTWEKGDKTNRYHVNGTLYDKVERGAPPFLEPLGLHPFIIGDDEVCLHVSDQFQPVFLLDRRSTEVAEAVADVGHLDRIHEALRNCESDRREAGMTRKVRDQDVASVTTRLGAYQDLDATLASLIPLDSDLGAIEILGGSVDTLAKWEEQIRETSEALESLEVGVSASLLDTTPPSPLGYKQVSAWLDTTTKLDSEVSRLATALQDDLAPVPKLDTSILPVMRKALALESLLDGLPQLPEIPPPPSMVEAQKFLDIVGQAQKLAHIVKGAARDIAALDLEIAELEKEMEALGPLCPTCSRPRGKHAH